MTSRSLLIAALCVAPAGAVAQERYAPASVCEANARPDFGFDTIDCVNCEISARGQSWVVFHRPPVIRGVRTPGPAAGKLQDGDTLIAIDGLAITSREAAARYGNAARGDTVELRMRRGGTTISARVVVGDRCATFQRGFTLMRDSTFRYYWKVHVHVDSLKRRFDVNLWSRRDTTAAWFSRYFKRDSTGFTPKVSWALSPEYRWIGPRDSVIAQPGWIGIAMFRMLRSPEELRTQDAAGFVFAEPPEIAAVAPGSPADSAGIVAGDTLWSVDGLSVRTRAGAQRFLNAPAGVPLELALHRRGATISVRVVPKDPPSTPPARTRD